MSWVRFPGQTLVTGNVWGKSCTGGINFTNVLDLSVLHVLNKFNRKPYSKIDLKEWNVFVVFIGKTNPRHGSE